MKIVFCTQNMAPFRMKWMDEIAKYHDVVIYHLNEYENGLNKRYISYIPSRAIVKCKIKKKLGGGVGYSACDIFNEKADVYILDGYGFRGQQELIFKFKMKRIPFLMSIDGGFIRCHESILKKYTKRYFISKASAYLSTSNETDKYINYYGGEGKIKYRHFFSNIQMDYIENRPTTDDEKQKIKEELKMENEFSVISVGKFEHRKGFDLLIKALEKSKGNIHIYFIGSSDHAIYDSLIEENIKTQIHFINFCDQEILKKYYKAAELLLLPTREDIWGLVILEGMANGIQVVTTDRCLAGVALLEKKEIIPVNSIEAITNILEVLQGQNEEERYRIGIRNIEKVRNYAIERATINDIEHLNDFYKKYCKLHTVR